MTEREISDSESGAGTSGSSTVTRRDVLKRATATMGIAAVGLTASETAAAQSGQGIVVGECPTHQYFVVLEEREDRELECGEETEAFERCYLIRVLKPTGEDEYCLTQPRTLCTNTLLEPETFYAFEGQLPCECDGGSGSNCRVIYEPAEPVFDELPPCENGGGCVDFSGFAPDTQANFPFTVGRFTFDTVNPQPSFPGYFVDWWPTTSPDGTSELEFPGSGIVIDVPRTSEASVEVAAFHPKPIALEAYDASGNLVDRTETTGEERRLFRLSVRDSEITELVVGGADNEGILLEVCIGGEA